MTESERKALVLRLRIALDPMPRTVRVPARVEGDLSDAEIEARFQAVKADIRRRRVFL